MCIGSILCVTGILNHMLNHMALYWDLNTHSACLHITIFISYACINAHLHLYVIAINYLPQPPASKDTSAAIVVEG